MEPLGQLAFGLLLIIRLFHTEPARAGTVLGAEVTEKKMQPLTSQSSYSGCGEKHGQCHMEVKIKAFTGGHGRERKPFNQTSSRF